MEIGDQVKVQLPAGWYYGKIVAPAKGFDSDIRWEVHGSKPAPFVTTTRESGSMYLTKTQQTRHKR